jgi:SAM-dependent methyltransferase
MTASRSDAMTGKDSTRDRTAGRATFRDPAGSLSLEGDQAIRSIYPTAREEVLSFVESNLYSQMLQRGDIVATTIDDDWKGLRLLHPRIEVSTYPWEWTSSQWLAAGDLTLRLCEEGLEHGWILKDATPLNILFVGCRPILVDVVSFERRKPCATLWLAYAQYVRTFLLPLLAHRMLGWPMALALLRRDGFEPAEVFASLSWPQRLSVSAFWAVTLPTLLEKRESAGTSSPTNTPGKAAADDETAVHILKRMLASLRRKTEGTLHARATSSWSRYNATLKHYSTKESEHKGRWISRVLTEIKPRRVLDVGANTGEYSVLAAQMGIDVIALERDPAAADRLFRLAQELQLPILTILADLARPTPAMGWENSESSALLPRLEGKCDLVMLLAVIHHLLLLEQIPLPAVIALCHRLTLAHLVIEWVPATDPMFQSLMRGRDALYGALAEQDLLAACHGRFSVLEREPLENGRILFLLRKIDEPLQDATG